MIQLRRWWGENRRIADIRYIRTLYGFLGKILEEEVIPAEPFLLILTVPPSDWKWLERIPWLKERYQHGLTEYALRFLGQKKIVAIVRVELEKGERWGYRWQKLLSLEPPESKGGFSQQAYFIVPSVRGAFFFPRNFPEDPREPTLSEQTAEPERMEFVLNNLSLVSTSDRRWPSGEKRVVCGKEVWFIRTRLGGDHQWLRWLNWHPS